MEYKSSFPVVVTAKLLEARDFYVKYLGFETVFEAEWYVQLHAQRAGGGKPIELAFMKPDQTSQPAALHPAFNGDGVILTLEVEDVDLLYEKVHGADCDTIVELRDEPWGQRHFLIRDPTGSLLDIVAVLADIDALRGSQAQFPFGHRNRQRAADQFRSRRGHPYIDR